MMKGKRNTSIDVIKGVCILFIIITHYDFSAYDREFTFYFPFWIDMAVPIFMFISGYVGAASQERRGPNIIDEVYRVNIIIIKWLRFLVPYTIVFVLEMIFSNCTISGGITIKNLLRFYIFGGGGPGSYYVPMMLQFVIIFPTIYFLIKKNDGVGLILVVLTNQIYEHVMFMYSTYPVYRVILLRYIGIIGVGIYTYLHRTRETRRMTALVISITGLLFIILEDYLGKRVIVQYFEPRISLIAALYIVPLVLTLINRDYFNRSRYLKVIGECSYEIYCFQMLYYGYIVLYIYRYIKQFVLRLCINIMLCVAMGVLLHFAIEPITKRITSILAKCEHGNKETINNLLNRIIYKT